MMHSTHFNWQPGILLLTALWLLATAQAQAQTAKPAAPVSATSIEATDPTPVLQRLVFEDQSLRIEELRAGGETKSINVTPKNGMPSYEVAPDSGQSSWQLLNF